MLGNSVQRWYLTPGLSISSNAGKITLFCACSLDFSNAVPIGVQKGGSQYSPAIYTMDIAYKIDIPLFIFDRYITGI